MGPDMWAAVAVWRKADLATNGRPCTGWSNLRYIGRIYDFRRYLFHIASQKCMILWIIKMEQKFLSHSTKIHSVPVFLVGFHVTDSTYSEFDFGYHKIAVAGNLQFDQVGNSSYKEWDCMPFCAVQHCITYSILTLPAIQVVPKQSKVDHSK